MWWAWRYRASLWRWTMCMCIVLLGASAACYSPLQPNEKVSEPPLVVTDAFRPRDEPTPDACGWGESLCSGQCVDLQTNTAHCGRCENRCSLAQSCVAAACACPTGTQLCAGACEDTLANLSHCGVCGHACAPGEACKAGTCIKHFTCEAPLTMCGVHCVDLQQNVGNCGACGNGCSAGSVCDKGTCSQAGCSSSADCAVGEVCIDRTCGPCRRDGDCPSKEPCLQGLCKKQPCQKASDCSAGLVCVNGVCLICSDDTDCPREPGPPYKKTQQKAIASRQRATFTYSPLDPASGKIQVKIEIKGDYTASSEYATIVIDGKSYGKFAPDTSDRATKIISLPATAADDGKIIVTITNSENVDHGTCWGTVSYTPLQHARCKSGRCQ